jgi:hypothetical protein
MVGVGSEFLNIINMYLNVKPVDTHLLRRGWQECDPSLSLSVQYRLLVSVSFRVVAGATRSPLCGTVGLPPSYTGAHGGRTGYYRSVRNSV